MVRVTKLHFLFGLSILSIFLLTSALQDLRSILLLYAVGPGASTISTGTLDVVILL